MSVVLRSTSTPTTAHETCVERGGQRRTFTRPRLCAMTDPGRARPDNQDDFYVGSTECLWIVADGMGGQAAGDLASANTINAIVDGMTSGRESVDPAARLANALHLAQDRVRRLASEYREYRGMGSAVAAAYRSDDALHVCHAGDVRCYIRSAGVLERVTSDHSVAARMVRARILTDHEARLHPGRNMLEQAVGIAGQFQPVLTSRRLAPGDRVLLCSDGLWGALEDEAIDLCLSWPASIAQIVTELVDRANAVDGSDNITALVYEHGAA